MSERRMIYSYRGSQPIRLDKYLVEQLPTYSRTRIQQWIKQGRVKVDGVVVLKTGQALEKSGLVEVQIPPPAPSGLVPEAIPLDVIFENKDLILVNKPAGMVVHPAAGHTTGTLVHAALAHAPEMEGVGGVQRPGVVHRLDKNTSGLILLAKQDSAHQWLQEQFRARKVEKLYLALVDGHPATSAGRVEAAIGRDTTRRSRMTVVIPGKGRPAITEFNSLEAFKKHTYLEARPITGRTHQIRVHMAFLECPVVGDTIYGLRQPSLPIDRFFLHAARLRLRLPGSDQLSEFSAPLPEELTHLLSGLRN